MILFSAITLVLFLWNLHITNQLRLLRGSTQSLKAEVDGAVATCGRSMN